MSGTSRALKRHFPQKCFHCAVTRHRLERIQELQTQAERQTETLINESGRETSRKCGTLDKVQTSPDSSTGSGFSKQPNMWNWRKVGGGGGLILTPQLCPLKRLRVYEEVCLSSDRLHLGSRSGLPNKSTLFSMICSFKAVSKGYPAVSISLYGCQLNSYLQGRIHDNNKVRSGYVGKIFFLTTLG